MTLATRCPACGTAFRVVQDQLRVSHGWVRCGRCSEAFNAMESMVDLPAVLSPDPATHAASAASAASTVNPASPTAPAPQSTPPAAPPVPTPELPITASSAEPVTPQVELPPGIEVVASDGAVAAGWSNEAGGELNVTADAPIRTEPSFDIEPPVSPAPTVAAARVDAIAGPVAASEAAMPTPMGAPEADAQRAASAVVAAGPALDATGPAPSFLRQAERAERWRRPRVRLALATGVVVAALGLVMQATYTFRDRLAATMPWLRPSLQQACATLGCRVGDYRLIEALSVESSGLTRVEGAPVYRLAVTLRNRAPFDVAAPALDLTLTDPQGRQIARRVLQMSDLQLPLRYLKAGSELPIQVSLGIADRQVSGYTVEIFYP